jgi:translocation and assembly module TamB
MAAPPPKSPIEAPTVADALSLAIDLTLGADAWIRRPDANVQLGGAVRLDKVAHGPLEITGTLRLLRGTYVFQGRRFTVDRGEIVLPPGQNAEPALDVTATYRVGGYFVTVQVNGPIDRPTLTLSSDPPLEQADILAVLLFGRPTTTLGPTEATALQRETVQLAAGYAAPELSSSVRDALGLDLLDVSMPEGATTPGEVKVGRYVTDDVFVTLAQEFGPRLAQIVGLEYHLRRNLSVRLSTSTRGASAVDVFWHRRY